MRSLNWFERVDDFLPSRKKKRTDNLTFGVEIEVEFEDPDDMGNVSELMTFGDDAVAIPENFSMHEDGSLRNGLEMVSTHPHRASAIIKEVDSMYDFLQGNGAVISKRCSTHIHMDVRNFNYAQLCALMTIWSFYEYDFLKKCVAPHRLNNKFCLLDYITPNNLLRKFKIFGSHRERNEIANRAQRYRYQAMNVIDPLFRQGSVEFRSFEGNLDIEKFQKWINMLVNLADVAKKFSTFDSLYKLFNMLNNHPISFKKKFFGCKPENELNYIVLDVVDNLILQRAIDNEKLNRALSDL